MNGIKLEGFDIEKLRERLRKMTDAQLLEFGRAGRKIAGVHNFRSGRDPRSPEEIDRRSPQTTGGK
jgi:hypothetical protein